MKAMKKLRIVGFVEVVALIIFSIKACFKPHADVALFGHEEFLATNNGYLLACEVRGMWILFLAVCQLFAILGITDIGKMRIFSWAMSFYELVFGSRLAYFGLKGRLNNSFVGAGPLFVFAFIRIYLLLT